MPFTVNVGPYQGGSFLAGGLSNFGEGIAKGLEEMQKAQKEEAANQILYNFAVNKQLLSPEEQADFIQGNHTKKRGIMAGLAQKMALTFQQQKIDADRAESYARANLYKAEAADRWKPFTPVPVEVQLPDGRTVTMIQRSRNSADFLPGEKAHPDAGKPYYVPGTNKQIGVIKQSGDIEFFPAGVTKEAQVRDYLGKLKPSDLDTNRAWESEDGNTVNIPVLSPEYTGKKDEEPYVQVPNPDFGKKGGKFPEARSITQTIKVPKRVWDKYQAGGIDLSHVEEEPPQTAAAPPQQAQQTRFGSEEEARKAGFSSGQTVLLFDPATKRYRPAVLH